MQFTPQQMAGYKGYGNGVLIGNWREDYQITEDKATLYRMAKAAGTQSGGGSFGGGSSGGGAGSAVLSGTLGSVAAIANMTEPSQIGPATKDNFIPFQVPLQIASVASPGAVLAIDTTARYSPKLNFALTTFTTPTSSRPVARSVWILQKVKDENDDFYRSQLEQNYLHYGQNCRVVNEEASPEGAYSLFSSMQDLAKSSGRNALTACLSGGNGAIFTVEPFGKPQGTKDGVPVSLDDQWILVHRGTNLPVACDAAHRTATSVGTDIEASCAMIKSQQTRAQNAVATQKENLFQFVMAPAGTPYKPNASKSQRQAGAMERVRAKIVERGGKSGFRGIVRSMKVMDDNGDKKLSRPELHQALTLYGVLLTPSELDAVFQTFDRNGDGVVTITEFLRGIRGPMNARRQAIVQEAFQRLNKDGQGDVELSELIDVLKSNASKFHDAGDTGLSHEEVVKEFMASFGGKDGRITSAQFADYYSDVSAGIDSDDYFELMIRNAWHISGGEGVSANTTCRRVLVEFTNGSQQVIELRDDLGIRAEDGDAIRKKLAAQGVTNIAKVTLA